MSEKLPENMVLDQGSTLKLMKLVPQSKNKYYGFETTNQNLGENESSDVLVEIFNMRVFKCNACKEKQIV